jgi:hypothetical protein
LVKVIKNTEPQTWTIRIPVIKYVMKWRNTVTTKRS